MSDTSEDTTDRQNDKDDNVCRDFVRGTCERKFCKFKHENEIPSLNFCHDFQNNVCPRLTCKFIHCSPEEVEEYKRSGEMSNQILAEATRKNQFPGTPPICKQFKKGLCRRTHCKFRHVSTEQEEQDIMELIQRKQGNINVHESHFNGIGTLNGVHVHRRNGVSFDEYQESGLPLAKRRFAVAGEILNRELQLEADRNRPVFQGYFAGSPPPGVLHRVDARTLMLEEENNLLHKEIAQLKRQVQDLTATNEFLLDQIANLRVSGKQNTVTMPAVTLTSTSTQPQVIRTVTASVATVPVSLATVTTGNPVSIAGCPTVSIASPAQILAPSQQILVTTNSGQQLALATSTQQLTSQAQHMANQQLALANASQQLTTQSQQLALASSAQTHQQLNQQLANQQLTSQAQQLALASTTQQLTSQAQQLALANTTQQLTSQAQQLALANAPQQLTSQAQAQQLALANTTQQLTLANANSQLLAAQQNLAASTQQIELHRSNQMTAINTSQTMAMSNATQPMVSYPIMTQSLTHPLAH